MSSLLKMDMQDFAALHGYLSLMNERSMKFLNADLTILPKGSKYKVLIGYLDGIAEGSVDQVFRLALRKAVKRLLSDIRRTIGSFEIAINLYPKNKRLMTLLKKAEPQVVNFLTQLDRGRVYDRVG